MNTTILGASYNYLTTVTYTNNTEYRECFRKVFRINREFILENLRKDHPDFDTYEEETIDELLFDQPHVNLVMDEIMKKTQHIIQFRELYRRAGCMVFSMVPDIGLAILFSYDFFADFHRLLSDFFQLLAAHNGDMDLLKFSTEFHNFLEKAEGWRQIHSRLDVLLSRGNSSTHT